MHRIALALLSVLPALSGCYLAHDVDGAPFDPEAALPPVAEGSLGIAPGTCRVESRGLFVVPGAEDVSSLQITAVGAGFFGLYERRGPFDSRDHPNLAVAGMLRGDVGGMARQREVGDFSFGALHNSTLERGGDGRLAVCADSVSDRFVGTRTGAVVFLAPDGSLERIVPVEHDCADVAYVAGRWVALEVDANGLASEASLSILDATLTISARVPLGTSDPFELSDRVVAFGERALVLMAREAGEATLVMVDVEAQEVLMTQGIDVEPWSYDLAVYGGEAHVFSSTPERGLEWRSYDADLVPTQGPTPLLDHEVIRALTVLPDGIAVVADHTVDRGELLLLDPISHAVFPVVVDGPPERTGVDSSWFDVAANGDYVLVSSWTHAPIVAWTWGARCRIR